MKIGHAICLGVMTLLLGAVSIAIAGLVEKHVPQPYMDEIFHIPQAQRYCQDGPINARWDDKITTLPGLYLVSLPYVKLVSLVFGAENECGTYSLRSINIAFLCTTFVLIAMLLSPIRTHMSNIEFICILLKSLQLSFLPVMFFFTFLYYTDIGSVLFILLAYLLARREAYTYSAIGSACAVIFRQTNIIWTFWIALNALVEWFEHEDQIIKHSPDALNIVPFLLFVLNRFTLILRKFIGYIIVAIMFVSFVLINKGLVVGDRTNHIAIIHVPQVLYFSVFCSLFMGGDVIICLYRFIRYGRDIKSLLYNIGLPMIIGTPFVIVLSLRYSYVHMFLLSDNRHYLFYLWRKLFHIHITPGQIPTEFSVLYGPVYVAAILFLYYLLKNKGKSTLSITFFSACVILNLTPLPLIEFRYFIVPFLILNIMIYSQRTDSSRVKKDKRKKEQAIAVRDSKDCLYATLINILLYSAINAFTIYMFLYKPFTGPDGKEARLMW